MVVGASLIAASGAEAQTSFFDMIFGSSQPQPQYRPVPRAVESVPPRAHAAEEAESGQRSMPRGGGATYRTICVRTCDGFFFPISFATTRNNFSADQKKCEASCSEARIFVYRNPGEGVEDAIDLSGRPYTRIPNAFKFRKVHVEQCGCRPAPWTEAELKRHRAYAANEDNTLGAEPTSGETDMADDKANEKTAADNPLAVAVTETTADASDPEAARPPAVSPKASDRPRRAAEKSAGRKPVRSGVTSTVATAGAQGSKASAPSGGGFGLFSMGLGAQPQYVWPGDPPRRR